MVKINYALISKEIAASKNVGEAVRKSLVPIVEEAKAEMLHDLDEHVITKEIREGPEGANISATLPAGYGNLFSFIGFEAEDSDPIADIVAVLKKIELPLTSHRSPFIPGKYRTINFTYRIPLPSVEEFPNTTYPDDWREGSWVAGIEDGIPGFESYLFDENFDAYTQSRSTTALQAKDRSKTIVIIRDGIYQPVKYISEILDKFVERLS